MYKIVVFGQSGQVATSLEKRSQSALEDGLDFIFISSSEANFLEPLSVIHHLDLHCPQIVINTSAYTAVDKAEEQREFCEKINSSTVAQIAKWCAQNHAWLIHYSTDYVFDGSGEHFRDEQAPTAPLNWYGQTKLHGEKSIISSGCQFVIFRTSWIYSEFGHNFLKTMLRLGSQKSVLKVVNDQIGSPTYAKDIAEFTFKAIKKICDQKMSPGIYNLVNDGVVSWYEFAIEIFAVSRALGQQLEVQRVFPIPSSEYPTPAQRPLNSRLSLEKLSCEFQSRPRPWKDALTECLTNWFKK